MPAKKNWKDLISVDSDTQCWEWTGALSEKGRPALGGRPVHRLVYKELRGDVPPVLHHECRNILCVNPDHMHGYQSNSEHVTNEHTEGRFKPGQKPWSTGKRISPYPSMVEPSGRIRSTITITCEGCGTQVTKRRDRPGKFCGLDCALTNARAHRKYHDK